MRSKVVDFQERSAPELESKDEAWFLDQLERHTSEVFIIGNDFKILCPNPNHADNNPSCNVNRHGGFFKCFSCNFGGGWNLLASLIGADKLQRKGGSSLGRKSSGDMKDTLTRALKRAGVRVPTKVNPSRPLVSPWSVSDAWRDVGGKHLVEVGCIKVVDLEHNTVRIGLPVRDIEGDLLGYTCRAIDPVDAEPKYTPLEADKVSWRTKKLPAREALFMGERILEDDWEVVVLVEGPYDALRLWAEGIPAVAILGAGNWTDHKAAILSGLGLKSILVLMDNDKAGREVKGLVIDAMASSVRTVGLRLPPSCKDPGMLSKKQCAWVRSKVDSALSN